MIGVIADDVTGATDVAAALSRAGLRTSLALRADLEVEPPSADAIVIGLKTRSIAPAAAVRESLAALATLRRLGASHFYLKYCSTFDSTDQGNIGPVTEALAAALGVSTVVTTPAAPLHGRTVYAGHLFVGDTPLHETHMRDHPVTPMRDSSLRRLLQPQVTRPVSLIPLRVVRSGAAGVRELVERATRDGDGHLILDATGEEDLAVIAEAIEDQVLAAGSAGLVGAMGRRHETGGATFDPAPPGRTAIIAGSCSQRTLEQIARFEADGQPAYRLVASRGEDAQQLADRALAWWDALPALTSALLYSSSPPNEREGATPEVAALYEETAGILARSLAERGIRRLLIAGGETSGSAMAALGTDLVTVGAEATLGAPWVRDPERDVYLVLKSGNFGDPDFFVRLAREGTPS